MNYVKNNKRRLIAFTKTSIVFATVSPIIINFDSAEAMFKSSVKNPTSPKGGSVQSIISRFEGISSNNTSSTLASSQNTKPKLLPKPLSISGIKYPYSEPSSNVESKISDAGASGVQSPSTKPKVRFSPYVKVKIFNPNERIATSTGSKTKPIIKPIAQPITKPKIEQSTRPKVEQSTQPITKPKIEQSTKPSTRPKVEQSTKPITRPKIEQSTRPITKPPKPQFNLKITNSPTPNHKPINISERRMKNLEALVKVNVAAIVKENLPENFTANGPIPIKFDKTSGQELSAALSRFIYVTTQNTLKSLSQKQD